MWPIIWKSFVLFEPYLLLSFIPHSMLAERIICLFATLLHITHRGMWAHIGWRKTNNYLKANVLQILETLINRVLNAWFFTIPFKRCFHGAFLTSCCTQALLSLEINNPLQHRVSRPSWVFSYFTILSAVVFFCKPNDKNMANFMSLQNWSDESFMPKDGREFLKGISADFKLAVLALVLGIVAIKTLLIYLYFKVFVLTWNIKLKVL